MTASCTLCGQSLSVVDSVDARARTLGELGKLFQAHIQKEHKNQPQTAFDEADVKASLPQLLHANFSPMLGMTLQGAILFSYLQSADPLFIEGVTKLRAMVDKAMEQKPVQPLVSA